MSKFLDEIFDKKEKVIGESSRKLYKANLLKLNNGNDITNLLFLKKVEDIMKIIEHLKPTTQRSYIIAICSILNGNKEYQKLYEKYFDILANLNNSLKVNTDKSDTQKKNWIEINDIQTIYDTLKKAVVKKANNKKQYDDLLDFVILSLYFLQAPRRNIDYTLMKISSNMDNSKFNYLDLIKRQFIFNNYKTKGAYNQVIIDIDDDLFKNIVMYLKNKNDFKKIKNKSYDFYFLTDYNNEPFTNSNHMTKKLNNIFGANVSSSLLRNIYLSNKYSKVINELTEDTKDMGTSVGTAMNNYIKK